MGKQSAMAGRIIYRRCFGLTGKTHLWAVRESLVNAVAGQWAFTPRAIVDARSPEALGELIRACALFD
ncbi:MAG: hypothetical protein WBY88_15255 [Desulfosarcina sp.]